MSTLRSAALIGLALLVAVPAALPARAGNAKLLPHRAAYALSLSSSHGGSGIVAARGTMIYEFGRRCDGWTVENRTHLNLIYEGGDDAETRWDFASWESLDGRSFRFRAHFTDRGRTVERIAGRASRNENGSGTAYLSEPEASEIQLPAGTLFPTEHLEQMIDAAERGDRALTRVVFDGASVENPYLVHALFGPLPVPDATAMAKATGLPAESTWWSRLAFFPEGAKGPDAATPEFELGARYRSDGVADHITQHFAEFSLDVKLQALEQLPPPDC